VTFPSDPLLTAARATLAESLDELRSTVAGLTPDALNRRITGEGTNPLAVIATHALASTRSWLSLAVGAPLPPRDRPAEFRAVADEGFETRVDDGIADCLALLDAADGFDPALEGLAPWRTSGADEPVTASWALLHAIGHLGEHVGHAHVMRDLLRGASPGTPTPAP
jgi:uncharacterized damage-inducible protein DinB